MEIGRALDRDDIVSSTIELGQREMNTQNVGNDCESRKFEKPVKPTQSEYIRCPHTLRDIMRRKSEHLWSDSSTCSQNDL